MRRINPRRNRNQKGISGVALFTKLQCLFEGLFGCQEIGIDQYRILRRADSHQQPLFTGALPGKGQKAISDPVALPGRDAFERLPLAVAHDWMAEHSQQPVVELF